MLRLSSTGVESTAEDLQLKIPLGTRSKTASLLVGIGAIPLAGLAFYLFLQASNVPILKTQFWALSAMSSVAASYCLFRCYKGLQEHLVINGAGIRLSPSLEGIFFDWSDISAWEIVEEDSHAPYVSYLRLWSRTDGRPYVITYARLDGMTKLSLVNVLRRHAPNHELR